MIQAMWGHPSIPIAQPQHKWVVEIQFYHSHGRAGGLPILSKPTRLPLWPSMAPSTSKGSWTPDEDQRLTHCIQTHGAKKWKIVATRAGLRRCGKSCRLRWLNYLRPNIKRGGISSAEEDLIFRLHSLLGNRWSLIAGRLPGRTDNEIKNYWNSHLSKKSDHKEASLPKDSAPYMPESNLFGSERETLEIEQPEGGNSGFDVDTFLDFSEDRWSLDLEWVKKFFEETDDNDHNSPHSTL